jgi:hypothetical protein
MNNRYPLGYVVYDGPSTLTRARIVAILTGVHRPSDNPGTGPMAQLWILQANRHPVEAIHAGTDVSVCGTCPLRPNSADGGGGCYVNPKVLGQVWRTWSAGKYAPVGSLPARISAPVRLGAYGDPAAVPIGVLQDLVRRAPRWTGYTHQWRYVDPTWADLCMASVESEADATAARALGYRTFRLRSSVDQAPAPGEIVCPKSAESGHKTDCYHCGLCNGLGPGHTPRRRPDVLITVHGSSWKKAAGVADRAGYLPGLSGGDHDTI